MGEGGRRWEARTAASIAWHTPLAPSAGVSVTTRVCRLSAAACMPIAEARRTHESWPAPCGGGSSASTPSCSAAITAKERW